MILLCYGRRNGALGREMYLSILFWKDRGNWAKPGNTILPYLLVLLKTRKSLRSRVKEVFSQNKVQELVCTIQFFMLSLFTISLDNQILSDLERETVEHFPVASHAPDVESHLLTFSNSLIMEKLKRVITIPEQTLRVWIKFIKGKAGFFRSVDYKNLDRQCPNGQQPQSQLLWSLLPKTNFICWKAK